MADDRRTGQQQLDDLWDAFGPWTIARGVDVDLFVIDAALDLMDDEDLAWTADDIHQLLVEWFPRKVTMEAAERPGVITTLHSWIDFLAELSSVSPADATALHAEIDRTAAAFLAAMADERNYGVAKFWTTRMLENGVNTDDQAEVQRFLVRAQAGEIDYDQAVLDEIIQRGSFEGTIDSIEFGDDEDRLLPPVSLATTDELTTLAAAAPLATRLRTFVAWVGTGRILTSTKRLRIADAKELADLLDVDQPFLRAARSSADLPQVSLLVEWAKAARLVRVVKGKLVGIKSAAGLLNRPLDLWQRAFDTLPDLGPAICPPTSYYESPSLVGQLLPDVTAAVWLSLYTAGGTLVPMEMLVEITRDAMVEPGSFSISSLIVDAREMLWRRDLAAVLAALELLGAVERAESTDTAERDKLIELCGNDDPDLTLVRLTQLGIWGARNALRAEGFEVPLVEDLAGESVGVLCEALEHATPEVIDVALTAWVASRGEDAAAAELATFCADAPSASARLVAMNGMAHAGAPGVAQAKRLRSAGGLPGAVATAWLIQHSGLDQNDASKQDLLLALADNLAAMGEHDMLIDQMTAQPIDEQVNLIRALAATDHPDRAELLDVIATQHPEHAVAIAARNVPDSSRSRQFQRKS
jgi:hypothetical protein